MEKFLKNFQWLVLLYGVYNVYAINEEYEPKPEQVRQGAEKIREKLNKNKKVKKEIDEFYKNIEEAKLKIEKVKESVEKTQQLLPGEISDIENVALLRRTGEDLNIKTMSIEPDVEVTNGIFISKKYKFRATATYIQFLILFERISNNKRVLNIKDLNLKGLSAGKRGGVQLLTGFFTLEAYRFNPNFKEPEAEGGGTGGGGIPALPAAPKTSLNKYKLPGAGS